MLKLIQLIVNYLGGVHEAFKIRGPELDLMEKVDPDVLWEIMFRSLHMKSLCNTSIEIKDHIGPESLDINGLVMGEFSRYKRRNF